MSRFIIKTAPDYLALSAQDFVRHFSNLLTTKRYKHWVKEKESTMILGYSCRALFDLCMQYFSKENLIVAATPIHHTSFRNIIENYTQPENIHVIDLNKNFNGIGRVPKIKKCDIVVITHLFGQDMDLSKLKKFKEKHNCIIIEDRVQGGEYDTKFAHEIVDISIYSMAMDKRPIAMGGGYMHINNKHDKTVKDLIELIDTLPQEKVKKRFSDLLKKIPTILLYNSRSFLYAFLCTLNLLNHFNKKINILNVSKYYRKENPGFSRHGYMLKPSQGLLKSMFENLHKYREIEKIYTLKYEFFMKSIPEKIRKVFFPWYKGNTHLTPYNTILVDDQLVDQFLEFFNENNMSSLPNPTYKIFNHSYKNDKRYKKFNDGIAYMPCIANMNKEEIIFLTNKIKEFYVKYQSKVKK